jgi:hypothetical protein
MNGLGGCKRIRLLSECSGMEFSSFDIGSERNLLIWSSMYIGAVFDTSRLLSMNGLNEELKCMC